MAEKQFSPWTRNFKIGAILAITGGLMLGAGINQDSKLNSLTGAGAAAAYLGMLLIKTGFSRRHGKIVEKKAIHSLRLPNDWVIKPNVMYPGVGDIDLVLETPEKEKWAIEIKSQQLVELKMGWFSGPQIYLRGKQMKPDPLTQMERNADLIEATGILWFPQVKQKSRKRLKSGNWVVMGGRNQLEKALGIRAWWNPF